MLKSISSMESENKNIIIGIDNMSEEIAHPLSLSYLALFICKEGHAIIKVNFKEYAIKANDIIVLAEDSIAIIVKASKHFRLFYCMANKSFASEIAYHLPNYLFLFLHQTPVLSPKKSLFPLLSMWITQIDYLMKNCEIHHHVMVRNHLQNLFLMISENIPNKEGNKERPFSRKEVISWKFWDLIGKHCIKHREVNFYAKSLFITPFYLSQITKAIFNDAPKTLIDRQVVLEIKSLLSSSNMSLKEIAQHLNFEDTSYLNRYFKRHTGMTLLNYRNKS